MSVPPLLRVLSPIVTALAFAACSTSDDSLDPHAGNAAGPVTLCHVPPDNPEDAHTLVVGAPAVDAHLSHGDTLGPCSTPCESSCDDVAAAVQDFCENSPPLPEELPPDFCEQAASIVESSCDASCPEPTPEECSGFCSDIVAETHMACIELTPDPFICDIGADVTYRECLVAFDCPPPPPNCYDDCFIAFEQANQVCEMAGGDPTCFQAAEQELELCHSGCCLQDCEQNCELECGSDPECLAACQEPCPQVCEPPPPPPPPSPCYDDCFLAFDQAIQACEMAGGDPACFLEAETALLACNAGCCTEECNTGCEMECGGDPECSAVCQESCPLLCGPPPPPEPTCEQLCLDEVNVGFADCVALGVEPTAPCAAVGPEQACLVQWQGFLNDCIYGEGGCIDPTASCEAGCGSAFADQYLACVDEPLCQDPATCQQEADASFDACMSTCMPAGTCPPELIECAPGVCILPDEVCPVDPTP